LQTELDLFDVEIFDGKLFIASEMGKIITTNI